MREAMHYERKAGGKVFCRLCPQACTIQEGRSGFCRVRKNVGGTLYSMNFGQCTAMAVDPVEKKPLYHFYPGRTILSLGTFGCNFRCSFCQNWQIAQGNPDSTDLSPDQVFEMAMRHSQKGNCIGVAYTYSEPLMWYEFVYETAAILRKRGLKNVLVTNGFINPGPLEELLPNIDAMNIDVKAFHNDFYKSICAGALDPVLRTVELAASRCHVEITTLLVSGLNDSEDEIKKLVDWIAGIDPSLPLHLSRYFPSYKLNSAATPLRTLERAREIAARKLKYVYLGNAPELGGENTICPQCGEILIERAGYHVHVKSLEKDPKGNRCTNCGYQVNITG